MGDIFKKHFAWFFGLSTPLNYKKPVMMSLCFFALSKFYTKTVKNDKYHKLKINSSHFTTVLSKS